MKFFQSKSIKSSSIIKDYKKVENIIEKRLREFKRIWAEKDHIEIFKEFIFCLLTPQSKAKFCWEAVLNLEKKNFLFKGSYNDIFNELNKVRFRKSKAKYIVENRMKFFKDNSFELINILEKIEDAEKARDFLVKNVKGYGLKEASHFLRNTGFSFELAILDRHILKNLKREGVIDELPSFLPKSKYLEIEEKFRKFSDIIGIPLQNLDLFFWWKETGEVFK